MGEEHLSEFLCLSAPAGGKSQCDILEREPLQVLRPAFLRDERDEGRTDGRDLVPDLPGHPIPVSRRARTRVRSAAGRQDHGIGIIASLLRDDALRPAVYDDDMRHWLLQVKLDLLFFEKAHEKVAHLLCIIAGREDTSAALDLGHKTVAMEQLQQVFIREGFVGAVEKFPIARCLPDEIHDGRAVCQIAAAFSGDAHLQADLRHFFKEHDLGSPVRCRDSGQKSRHAGSDDGDLFICGAHTVS